ncbi:hypothetical protein GTA08_BOTSDO12785 [Neofusicoccum parvum]|uniref:Uncharacterized protein n=1 Tax=Neofusicoccum parvum TaxID=310453 RepID=A0ACB5SHW3_9PEZI|nr:hypothetical protein GTA08_BOTSDO12785 [Neofusicoccum parvum]
MITPSFAAAAVLAALPFVDAAPLQARNATGCAPVHLLLARGTTEGYPGTLGSLVDLVIDAVPGADYENIIYPATDETSTESYFEGRQAVAQQLSAYAGSCPESKIVFLAYSQGAMIVGDALVGGGADPSGILGNATQPLVSPQLGAHITAISLYGDPRHVPFQPFDIGNGTFNAIGKYPRTSTQSTILETLYSHKIHDYCNNGDPVCASGDNIQAHLEYPQNWDTDAAAWLKSMVQ